MSSTDVEASKFCAGVPGPEGTFIYVQSATKRGDTEVKAECIVATEPDMVKRLKRKLGPALEAHEFSNWSNSNVELHLVISCAEDDKALAAVIAFINTWMAAVQADTNAKDASKFDDSIITIEDEPARTPYRGKRNKDGGTPRRDNRRRVGFIR